MNDETKVDLGEDLLESKPEDASSHSEPGSDILENARILMGEGLFEDAKKSLRLLIRQNTDTPEALEARSLLETIQGKEMQDLLQVGDSWSAKQGPSVAESQALVQSTREKLEEELRIRSSDSELKVVPGLFADELKEGQYVEQILAEVSGNSPQEISDLGVAYLEMGVFKMAIALFEKAAENTEYHLKATYLLAVALILGSESVEATIRVEPLVRDLALKDEQKIHFLYLMGLAFENLKEERKSKEYFRRVFSLNPRYRDVADKVR